MTPTEKRAALAAIPPAGSRGLAGGDRVGHALDGLLVEQDAGDAVDNGLAGTAAPVGDDRLAGRLRLDGHDAKVLLTRDADGRAASRAALTTVRSGGAVKRRVRPGAATQILQQRAVADDVQAEAQLAGRGDDQIDALVGQQARDDQEALAPRRRA